MGKVTRYFDQNDQKPENAPVVKKKPFKARKSKDGTLVYNVKVKPNVWGRRHADNQAKKIKEVPNTNPKFPGRAPINKELLEKHSRGEGMTGKDIKTGIHKKKYEVKEKNIKFSNVHAARNEILLTEDAGYLTADPGETTTQFTQQQIVESVDIAAATKHFELHLMDFGPYRMRYTRNGRHLLLGGKKGHVAAFDWMTKHLHCELNVMESVHDICWLHLETMFAVAQKDWVYIYDHQGIELHCIKRLHKVNRMEFLPYHFLLACAGEVGYLSWLDISIGQLVTQYNTHLGRLNMLVQNPYNAVLCLGHAKGVVSMWVPNSREPVAKMLCHKAGMTALHVDSKGMYMATAATDHTLKIWDVRKLEGPVRTYILRSAASNLSFSQNNMLAVGMGNLVEVYRDCCAKFARRAYIRHRFNSSIGNFSFCPFEDVLGVATDRGFASLLIPGASEPNFDGLEANPFQTKSQRREAEVKALLEKIPSDLISLDPTSIAEVDVPTLRDKIEAKKNLLYIKPPKINYEPRNKAKGRGGTVKVAKNKKIVQEQAKKEFIRTYKETKQIVNENPKQKTEYSKPASVLDRFLPKK